MVLQLPKLDNLVPRQKCRYGLVIGMGFVFRYEIGGTGGNIPREVNFIRREWEAVNRCQSRAVALSSFRQTKFVISKATRPVAAGASAASASQTASGVISVAAPPRTVRNGCRTQFVTVRFEASADQVDPSLPVRFVAERAAMS